MRCQVHMRPYIRLHENVRHGYGHSRHDHGDDGHRVELHQTSFEYALV